MVTKTLLFAGDGTDPLFDAYDKKTGELIAQLPMPGMQTGLPMTYMHNNRQFILVSVGSANGQGPQLVAYAIPAPAGAGGGRGGRGGGGARPRHPRRAQLLQHRGRRPHHPQAVAVNAVLGANSRFGYCPSWPGGVARSAGVVAQEIVLEQPPRLRGFGR